MPKLWGHPVFISVFVDVNHTRNVVTWCSHRGILIYVQNAPIIWYSKRQNTVEAAMSGSEFVALCICIELIVTLHHKLRIFEVPVEGPANVFCDNHGVIKNASIPELTLAKKHNAINYHAVWEAAAAGILRVGKEDGPTNLADLLDKVLDWKKWWDICWHIMWWHLCFLKAKVQLSKTCAYGVYLLNQDFPQWLLIKFICFTSYREDVLFMSWLFIIHNSQGPNESWFNGLDQALLWSWVNYHMWVTYIDRHSNSFIYIPNVTILERSWL